MEQSNRWTFTFNGRPWVVEHRDKKWFLIVDDDNVKGNTWVGSLVELLKSRSKGDGWRRRGAISEKSAAASEKNVEKIRKFFGDHIIEKKDNEKSGIIRINVEDLKWLDGDNDLVADAASTPPSPSATTPSEQTSDLGFLLGKSFHHYHLTLDKDGSREWHYTVLTFDKTQQGSHLPVAYVRQRSHDPHFDHRWYAYHPFRSGGRFVGFRIVFLGQGEDMPEDLSPKSGDDDIGWEFFASDGSDLDLQSGLQGVRVNKPYAADCIASSITLMSRHPVDLPGIQSGEAIVVPGHLGPLLLHHWNKLNGSHDGYGGKFVFPASMGMAAGASLDESRVLAFWGHYLITTVQRRQQQCLIFYGEPYFQRDAQHMTFVRIVGCEKPGEMSSVPDSHADKSEVEHRRAHIKKTVSDCGVKHDSYSFLNAGEVKAVLHLKRWFAQKGVDIDERSWSHDDRLGEDNKELNRSNAIIVGIPGVNGLISQYQEKFEGVKLPFRCEPDGIYKDSRPLVPIIQPETAIRGTAHALITRLPGQQDGGENTVVTLIVSDIGRAIQGAAKAVTNANLLKTICRTLQGDCPERWPEAFQLVIKVDLDSKGYPGNNAKHYELVESWPPRELFFSAHDELED